MTIPESADDTTLRLTRAFTAPRAQVFAAFIDPAAMRHWMAPGPFEITVESLAPGVGPNARFTMTSTSGDQRFVYDIIFEEIREPERVVWTSIWISGFPDQRETRVTVEFKEAGAGTEISLTHDFFPARTTRDDHGQGWTASLDTLDERLSDVT